MFTQGGNFFVTSFCLPEQKSPSETDVCSQRNEVSPINFIALRKAKVIYNFGFFECKRVKGIFFFLL